MATEPEGFRNQVLLRCPAGVYIRDGPMEGRSGEGDLDIAESGTRVCDGENTASYSPCGNFIASLGENKLSVFRVDGGELQCAVDRVGVTALSWSPCSRFILTWSRPSAEPNLEVWMAENGSRAFHFFHKSFEPDQWPFVQFSEDGAFLARAGTNVVQYFATDAPGAPAVHTVQVPGVVCFALSPGPAPHLAALVPEKKSKPGRAMLFRFGQFDRPAATKTFFNVQQGAFKWAPDGSAAVVIASTDVDSTGKSYYGTSTAHLLSMRTGEGSALATPKPGPVHDAGWAPDGRNFVLVGGSIPPNPVLFDAKGRAVFEFGEMPCNGVSWSPHGRFLCLTGYGNMPGDTFFWDRTKLKQIGRTRVSSPMWWGWSPCSRFFATATTAPRMNVDNGFHVLAYNGATIAKEAAAESHVFPGDKLLQFAWRPAPKGALPDRGPTKSREALAAAQGVTGSAAAKPAAVYRPPGTSAAFAERMRQRLAGGAKARRVDAPVGAAAGPSVPGAAPPGAGAGAGAGKSRSARRREQKKAREEAERAAAEAKELARAKAKEEAAAQAAADPEARAKRIRNLTKKLKQTDKLAKRQAAGEELDEDQLNKLAGVPALREELAALQAM